MEKSRVHERAPTSVNVTVGWRSREYLTEREIERLIEAAKQNRSGHRDATAILVAYRHGLRASELVALRWDDIDLTSGRLHVRRAKSGDASVHPISARESRALRKLLREAPKSPYVFISERGAPLSAAGYQRMVARAGVAAKFTFLVHSHMLRHACGFKLANDGHDTRAIQAYLGQPLDHVHSSLYGVDAQSVQELLEGLNFLPAPLLLHLGSVVKLQRPCAKGFKKFPQVFTRRLVGQLAFCVEFLVSSGNQ
jgi:integrase